MFHNHNTTYAKSTNAPGPAPEQVPPSSTASLGEVNAFNSVPPNIEFQGGRYDQPVLTFAAQALASHVVSIQQNAFPQPMSIPVLPGNPSQIYGGAQFRENFPNNSAGTPIYWEGGSQPSIPYEQPKQANCHSEKPGEAGVSFAGGLPTAAAISIPSPPPGMHSTPNEQGVFDQVWQLSNARVVPQSHEDLLLIIEMKKVGRSA